MKYTPKSEDENFNEWYKEFHLLFEDSHADEEECMEIAMACYDRAREHVEADQLITSNYHADDLVGSVAEALMAIHSGDGSYAGLRFSEELSRRCRARFAKEMEN